MVTLKCDTCGKDFQKKHSNYKYCSRECYYEMKRIRGDKPVWTDEMRKNMSEKYKGKGNPMYGVKGKDNPLYGKKRPEFSGNNHPNWKGGCYISKDGYIIHCINGKDVPEHRIVMENHLGRKLKSEEIIHHIDKDHGNNNIDNLQIVTRSEHMKLHREELDNSRNFKISHKEAEEIYNSKDKNSLLAKKYDVSRGYIVLIKRGDRRI